ncbi:hypothetical protein CEE45_02845 [Candidatus Heimdallarchaeota archaeon B3_Heim]|nr:MAG: hypothetical protein CEE45_02845 [Candidatus Heimdallarchaeota archaeon B3_Heim]
MEDYQARIEKQEAKIKTELEKWMRLTEENAPLIERVQQSEVEDYLATALRLVKGPGQEEKMQASSD